LLLSEVLCAQINTNLAAGEATNWNDHDVGFGLEFVLWSILAKSTVSSCDEIWRPKLSGNIIKISQSHVKSEVKCFRRKSKAVRTLGIQKFPGKKVPAVFEH